MNDGGFLTLGGHDDGSGAKIDTVFVADDSSFTLTCDRYVSDLGAVADGSRPVLVRRMRCDNAGTPRAGTAIWIHGEPFETPEEEPEAEQLALLSLGYEILAPLYPSTGGRPLALREGRIEPDFDDAVAEVIAAVRYARRAGGRVIVMGVGTGSILAAAAAGHLRATDKLVLQGPWMKPLTAVYDPQETLFDGPVAIDGLKGEGLEARTKIAVSKDLLEHFYGSWNDRDLVALVEDKLSPELLVVYGERDEDIDPQRLNRLLTARGTRHRSLVLRGSAHSAIDTRANLDRLIAELKR